jgi:hypothetical protein
VIRRRTLCERRLPAARLTGPPHSRPTSRQMRVRCLPTSPSELLPLHDPWVCDRAVIALTGARRDHTRALADQIRAMASSQAVSGRRRPSGISRPANRGR